MTAKLKEIESKRETAQLGLFDMICEDSSSHGMHFELDNAPFPMTFEERMK
jgi:hypothetical protein